MQGAPDASAGYGALFTLFFIHARAAEDPQAVRADHARGGRGNGAANRRARVRDLNLLAMLYARRIMGGVTMMVLQIVGAVLGVLQVGLAVEMILRALQELGVLHG